MGDEDLNFDFVEDGTAFETIPVAAPVCDPPGYHVFIEGELCQCGDRKRVLPQAPQLTTDSNVVGCARCGGDHLIRFKEFKRGTMKVGGEELTHWGLCPTTKEPVLMRFVDAE